MRPAAGYVQSYPLTCGAGGSVFWAHNEKLYKFWPRVLSSVEDFVSARHPVTLASQSHINPISGMRCGTQSQPALPVRAGSLFPGRHPAGTSAVQTSVLTFVLLVPQTLKLLLSICHLPWPPVPHFSQDVRPVLDSGAEDYLDSVTSVVSRPAF